MPYFTITDFAAGLDLRRSSLTAPAGTLRSLRNAHVSPGGEIEKRYAFVKFKTVDANTKGLVAINQRLYVFRPMTDPELSVIQHPHPRENSKEYAIGDQITVAASNPSRMFTCTTAGTSAATETYLVSSSWNPADKEANVTLTEGDLVASTAAGGSVRSAHGIAPNTKLIYFELVWSAGTYDPAAACGLVPSTVPLATLSAGGQGVQVTMAGVIQSGGVDYGTPFGAIVPPATICFAWDSVAKLVWARLNGGPWNGVISHDPVASVGGLDLSAMFATAPAFADAILKGTNARCTANFGPNFAHKVPSGFVSLNVAVDAANPHGYPAAVDGTFVTDGTAEFEASTPAGWTASEHPLALPPITEPVGAWDVGVMPIETPTLYEIVDYDFFDNKVFVVAWKDNTTFEVVRCFAGAAVDTAKGFFVKTYKGRVYSVASSVVYFSNPGDPMLWDDVNFLDLSLEDSDMTDCIALETYYDKLAIMSKTATQMWLMDPDPLKNQHVQTLRDAGTVAWRSVLQYGSGDVMYVAPSGIRSLRARNSSLAAAVSDIGSPLDPLLQDLFRQQGEDWMSGIVSILQPVTGRFWIILPDRILVLSAFPGPKITAWSQYDPGFRITAACSYQHHIVVRDDANNVYAYGGTDPTGPAYDDTPVELIFPFHSGETPATNKQYHGIDAAAKGRWEVSAATNVADEDVEDYIGLIDGPTFQQGKQPVFAEGTHLSLRLRAYENGPATLSNLIVHFRQGEAG